MNQYVQYGYYDPYSSGEGAVKPTGPPQQPGMGGHPISPETPARGGQAQHPPRAQQSQQPYQSRGPAPPAAQGPPPQPAAPHPPAQQPPGPARMDASETGSPPASGGVGPHAGPAAPPSATGGPQSAPGAGGMPADPGQQPLVDVMETPEKVVIVADVPGFEEEEITIQADESTIVIVAERAEGKTDEEYRVVRAERPRRLERLVQLPTTGNIDDASATHENGVCTVTIPKDGTKRREIGFH